MYTHDIPLIRDATDYNCKVDVSLDDDGKELSVVVATKPIAAGDWFILCPSSDDDDDDEEEGEEDGWDSDDEEYCGVCS